MSVRTVNDWSPRFCIAMSLDARAVVYDGSDVMPKEVGSGTFWTGMVSWIQGDSSEATTTAIEKSWPQ